jgi:hypothetical protein
VLLHTVADFQNVLKVEKSSCLGTLCLDVYPSEILSKILWQYYPSNIHGVKMTRSAYYTLCKSKAQRL